MSAVWKTRLVNPKISGKLVGGHCFVQPDDPWGKMVVVLRQLDEPEMDFKEALVIVLDNWTSPSAGHYSGSSNRTSPKQMVITLSRVTGRAQMVHLALCVQLF